MLNNHTAFGFQGVLYVAGFKHRNDEPDIEEIKVTQYISDGRTDLALDLRILISEGKKQGLSADVILQNIERELNDVIMHRT